MASDKLVQTVEQSVTRIVDDIVNFVEFEATAPGNWSPGAYAAQKERLTMKLRRSLIELLLITEIIE